MTPREFDEIYEEELERLKSMLPDPNKYPYHIYRGAIVIVPKMKEWPFLEAEEYMEIHKDKKGFHEVIFEKLPNLKTRKMEWRQIVQL